MYKSKFVALQATFKSDSGNKLSIELLFTHIAILNIKFKMSEVFSLMQQEYLWKTLQDVGNMVKTVLCEGSEQLKHLDRKISTFDQHQLSWPTEVNNYLLKWNVPVYDQEAIIAINSTHGSDLDIVRKSRENRIHQ